MARVQGCLFPPAMKCGLDPLVEAPSPLVLRLFISDLARAAISGLATSLVAPFITSPAILLLVLTASTLQVVAFF